MSISLEVSHPAGPRSLPVLVAFHSRAIRIPRASRRRADAGRRSRYSWPSPFGDRPLQEAAVGGKGPNQTTSVINGRYTQNPVSPRDISYGPDPIRLEVLSFILCFSLCLRSLRDFPPAHRGFLAGLIYRKPDTEAIAALLSRGCRPGSVSPIETLRHGGRRCPPAHSGVLTEDVVAREGLVGEAALRPIALTGLIIAPSTMRRGSGGAKMDMKERW
jgi:hypothetical protein